MASTATAETGGTDRRTAAGRPVEIPGVVDWLVAGLLALDGAALGALGGYLGTRIAPEPVESA